jgi:hypothetical protein
VLQRRHSSTRLPHTALALLEQYPYRSRPTLPTHTCSLRYALSICCDNAALFGGEMTQRVDYLQSRPALQHMQKRMASCCRSSTTAFRYALLVLQRDDQAAYLEFTHTLSVFPPRAIRRPGPQPGLLCVWEFLAVWLTQNVLSACGAPFSRAWEGCLAARPVASSCRSTSSPSAAVPPFDHRRTKPPLR